MKPLPRYFVIVFALLGDSTTTTDCEEEGERIDKESNLSSIANSSASLCDDDDAGSTTTCDASAFAARPM